MANHIIHRQQVVLEVSRNKPAYALQEAVSRMLHNGLPAKLEAVLDEVVPPDEIVRIDTLRLHLGAIEEEEFEQVFKERLAAALKQAVLEQKGTGSTTVLNQQQSLTAAFTHFLERGTLPWHKSQTSIATWEAEMTALFSAADWHSLVQWLQKEAPGSSIWQRLTTQFSDTFLQHFTAIVPTVFSHQEWNEVYAALLQMGRRVASAAAVRHQLWAVAIILPLREKSKIATIQQIIQAVSQGLQVSLREMINVMATQPVQSLLVQEAYIRLLKETAAIQTDDSSPTDNNLPSPDVPLVPKEGNLQLDATGTTPTNNSPGQNTADQTAAKPIRQQTPVSKKATTSGPEAVQYITNCGIVLLHPFLEMYFTELELVQQKAFVSEAARQRAILLLHYLATGETEVAEFDLVLQKLLCHLPPEDTLPAHIKLTEKEEQESAQLLQSVINYWPPLKNTSIEGLCHTFLQRQGRLETKEAGWLLTVEQKTVDILLSKLPWGFSTIRLPWIDAILNVEWM